MRNLSLIKSEETNGIEFSLEEVYALQSMLCLLNDEVDGLSPWVHRVRGELNKTEKRNCNLFCMTSSFLDGRDWPSVTAWVDHVESLSDEYMVKTDVDNLLEKARKNGVGDDNLPSRDTLFDDENAYAELISAIWSGKNMEMDRREIEDQHYLLTHPGEKRSLLTGHFMHMYDKYLKSEWESQLSDLNDSIRAFTSLNFHLRERDDAVLEIIQRAELTGHLNEFFSDVERIIFIPSAHIGPYIMLIDQSNGVSRVVHGARIPQGAALKSPSLVRSELLLKLESLADENRLKILQMISERGEVSMQEVIDSFDLSQSSISRHLKQLTANGFLSGRSQDRLKYFSLNLNRFDSTFRTLKRYLGG